MSLSTTRDGVNLDVTRWSYDVATGLCTNKVYADGSTETYTHTADALPLRETKPSGAWTENIYDANRRKIGVVSSDGALDVAMTRDVFGNVTSESNAVSFAAYSLDNRGNVTGEVQTVEGVSASLVRDLDAYGRLVRLARVGGEWMDCAYASDGGLCAVSNASANAAYSFTTDRLDAGYSLELAGGSSFSRVLRRHGYQRNCIVSVTNTVGNVAGGLSYAYDALIRPISRNDDSFGYNERGEVVFSRRGAENAEDSYTYDDIGNLLYSADNSATNTYVSNNRNQYTSILRDSATPRETSYDLDGNMTRHGDWTYSYDSGNRLVSVSSNNALVATFAYDAQGRRVKKVAADGTHRYFYDGWLLVYEHITRPDSTVSEIEYVWGKDVSGTRGGAAGIGGLLYLKRNGAIYVPWYDAYGNVMGYCDAQGNVVATYTYDAFGKLIASSGPMADVFAIRYSTKYFDSETGLYYYIMRYYSPELMRWITRDPIGEKGGVNLYAMCGNNLISTFDILGQRRMITGVFIHSKGLRAPKNSSARVNYLANDIMILRETMNSRYKNKKGGPQFNVQIKDLVLTPVNMIRSEIDSNSKNVFIIAHGYLKVNDVIFPGNVYEWKDTDKVEEGFFTGRKLGREIPLSQLGPNLDRHNIYACWLQEDVRRIKLSKGRIVSTLVPNVDNSLSQLLDRLKEYTKRKKTDCTINISIYEGDWDDYIGGTAEGLQNWEEERTKEKR